MTTVIRAAEIIDGTGAPPIRDGYLVIEDGRIAAVDVGAPRRAFPGADVFDFDDATVLPGLIDCHVHLAGLHADGWNSGDDPATVAANTLELGRGLGRVLRSGVTTVRDCGYPHHGIFAVRDAQERGLLLGPRLVLSGRAIRTSGGHGGPISVTADGRDAVTRAVRRELQAGADWIKLMMTGGTASPGERVTDVQISAEEAAAAVGVAHRRGRLVAAHCSNLAGTLLALDAGVDSIEHGIELDERAIERMLRRGTFLAPSLLCTRIEAQGSEDGGVPSYVQEKAALIYQRQAASFRLAHAAGVAIAAATDSGPSYLPIGARSVARELATMVELGMKPIEAIAAATGHAAKLLEAVGTIGSITVGCLADLIVVRDPLADLARLAMPRAVFQNGRRVDTGSAPAP